MLEIVWQYDPDQKRAKAVPGNAEGARALLEAGNLNLAAILDEASRAEVDVRHVVEVVAADLGLADVPGQVPKQEPFAVVLGCADARVPVELLFDQQANDLFVVRVAGNVPGDECIGSIDYAVTHMGSVRLLVVMGHTGCGAVTAAVDAFLEPASYIGVAVNLPLRAIVDKIMACVQAAADALSQVHGPEVAGLPGYRTALVETAVVLNAATTAAVLAHGFRDALDENLAVAYGVYNLSNHRVGLPGDREPWEPGLFAPFIADAEFAALGQRVAASTYVRQLLSGIPGLDRSSERGA
jgi:carbonic anhydrase